VSSPFSKDIAKINSLVTHVQHSAEENDSTALLKVSEQEKKVRDRCRGEGGQRGEREGVAGAGGQGARGQGARRQVAGGKGARGQGAGGKEAGSRGKGARRQVVPNACSCRFRKPLSSSKKSRRWPTGPPTQCTEAL
jgi:hypothetical protein